MSKIPPKIQSLGSTQAKETIYIDVDDEITAVIDKVVSSKAKIVALVLPKRATVMQSIVNMKLLKRTTEEAGKNIVLVTSEAGLLPLAGLVGMHIAATPTSKPGIPPAPDAVSDEPESVDEPLDVVDGTAQNDDFNPAAAAAVSVGALAANEPESILMPDEPDEDGAEELAAEPAKPGKPDKKLKVPSFNKFRVGIVLSIVLVIAGITAWIFAAVVLPKASVAITTDSTTITSDLNLTLDTTAQTLDIENKIIPAVSQLVAKTYSEEAPATGQQNNGLRASGNVYFALKGCDEDTVSIPTGSGISANGNTYITQAPLTLNRAIIGSKCNPTSAQSEWSGTVKVVAINGGVKFNVDTGTSFTVSASSNVTAKANETIAGGTDEITKVVAQADIDAATEKINTKDTTAVKAELEAALTAKGLMPVSSTFLAGDQQVTTSAKAGDKVESVKVTAKVPYTMLGIKQDDLKALVTANVKSQIDTKKQKITDDGVANAKFTQQNPGSPTNAVVAVKVRSTAGPELNAADLKTQVAGLKAGDIKALLDGAPGITDVQVAYSPVWVTKAPKDVKKITVTIDGVVK